MSVARVEVGPGGEKRVVYKHKKQMRWHIVGGLCLLNGYRIGAEIGVSTGRFSITLCALSHNMKMLAVDRWAEQPENAGKGGDKETYKDWNGPYWMEKLSETSREYLQDRITVRQMDSVEAAKTVDDGSLDFVFIDADHSYEGCKADIEAWTPKVRKGGLVSGHDYADHWPGVQKAVKEIGRPVSIFPDMVWAYFK